MCHWIVGKFIWLMIWCILHSWHHWLNEKISAKPVNIPNKIRKIKKYFAWISGWWATGYEVTNHSSVIHEYYARECNDPIHLTVDTSLQGGRMGLKAYVCIKLGVPGGKIGCMFTPINTDVTCYEPEVKCQNYFNIIQWIWFKTVFNTTHQFTLNRLLVYTYAKRLWVHQMPAVKRTFHPCSIWHKYPNNQLNC